MISALPASSFRFVCVRHRTHFPAQPGARAVTRIVIGIGMSFGGGSRSIIPPNT
jgi:hypothetical protein